ncbi:uncharacterized protein [Parasteatoda tepidariorum]|uniref:uncharacterized protein n=1 Tax=Parasteatoda tepidariorum TaxID=114398 RepID=UPI001C71FB86|nr:uncharacterized protein LOC122271640 [Parasteatoda tepidariorum]
MMSKYTFNPIWLMKDDGTGKEVSEWGKKHDDYSIFCQVCSSTVNISNKGFQAISQHAGTRKHQEQMDIKKNPLQSLLFNNISSNEEMQAASSRTNTLRTIYLHSEKESATVAELIWAMKTVASNYSSAASSDIVATFKAMFPNSIPPSFSLNPRKIPYLITDALAPYFKQEISEDNKNSFFTIMYDETTNSANKKELQTVVHYWSDALNCVISQHLKIMFIGSATAENIFKKVTEVIDEMKLPLAKVLMFESDGPNVNKKVHRLMNEEVKLALNREFRRI